MENFQVLEVFQASDRCDILGVSGSDNQHAQLRHIIQKGQIAEFVMSDIQGVQILAVLHDGHRRAGMPLGVIAVQRGKGGIVGTEDMPVVPEAHGHSEFDIRKAFMNFMNFIVIYQDIKHIHFLQVRKL